jgi:hypothetical protein
MDSSGLLENSGMRGTELVTPSFKSPHCVWWLVVPVLVSLLTYLSIVSLVDGSDLWAGFGNRALGVFISGIIQRTWVTIILAILTACIWAVNTVQASFAFSVASARPALESRRWSWTLQTLLLGQPSLVLLQQEALAFDETHGIAARQSCSFVESMMVKPETSSAHGSGHGIVPGTFRHRVEQAVEAPTLQLFILVLVLVDIIAVVLEVFVEVELVQFVDPEQGEVIEEILHFTSVGILSFFLLELTVLIYVYRRAFFVGAGSFWYKTDLVVVSVSLILQLVLHHGVGHGGEEEEEERELGGIVGLLILVRLPWRVIRIVHAVIVTLEKAHQEGEEEGREEEDEIMEKVRTMH